MTEDWKEQTPIGKVTCRSTNCGKDLHCFRRYNPRVGQTCRNEVCNQCGANLIDWDRLDKKDLKDNKYTFEALQHEMIRHHFWHIDIDEPAKTRAKRWGLKKIRDWTRYRLQKTLVPPSRQIYRDGMQTPRTGNIVYYAQHSTSTCCRKCVEEWYGIDKNRNLTDEELEYFVEIIMLYIKLRLPDLLETGE